MFSLLQVVLEKYLYPFSPLALIRKRVDCLQRLRNLNGATQLLDYYVDRERNEFVLVLEYGREFTLHHYLTNQHRHIGSPPRIAWKQIIPAIATALLNMWNKDVVYRDLEPKNVLIYVCNNYVDVKLLAPKTRENALISQAGNVCSESYRSPEQTVGDDDFDPETAQVYALGCILDNMVEGGFIEKCTASRVLTAQMKARNPALRLSLDRIAGNRWFNGDL